MDVPDLPPCWRVYPITHNRIFPPLWRLRAHRTFLPDQLEAQVPEWKDWAGQVANGGHEEYVRELHLYVTSDFVKQAADSAEGQTEVALRNLNPQDEATKARREAIEVPKESSGS